MNPWENLHLSDIELRGWFLVQSVLTAQEKQLQISAAWTSPSVVLMKNVSIFMKPCDIRMTRYFTPSVTFAFLCYGFRTCETQADRLSSGAEDHSGSMWAGLQSLPHGRRLGWRSHVWCTSIFPLTLGEGGGRASQSNTSSFIFVSAWISSSSETLQLKEKSLSFHQVAQYIKFEMPVLQSFIIKLKEEEDREVQKLQRR